MQKIKHRKIIYSPGIISLLLLPLLFIYFSQEAIKERTLTVLKINFFNQSALTDHSGQYSAYYSHFPPIRKYQDIDITGEINNDKALLPVAHQKIEELVTSNDTINGLHFTFGNNATYGTFVQLVDILKTAGAKTFMPRDNELWLYNLPPQETGPELHYFLCASADHIIYLPPLATQKNQAILFWTNSKEIITGFALFVIAVTIVRRRQSLKINQS